MDEIRNWHTLILTMSKSNYRGRFAPTPSGLLHAGSLATALASWLDAKAARGIWLIRIEDLDLPRVVTGADQAILQQLAVFGMTSDEPVVFQSQRQNSYKEQLEKLHLQGLTYPCNCSRKEITRHIQRQNGSHLPTQGLIYPGTCRTITPWIDPTELNHCRLAIRVRLPRDDQHQLLRQTVGDFVVRRADQIISYQLAVVTDDAQQGITHVVRGADLLDNVARQVWLQQVLNLPLVSYLHIPLVLSPQSEKLSKQTMAPAVWPPNPLATLQFLYSAASHLGIQIPNCNIQTVPEWLQSAILAWPDRQPSCAITF